MHIVTKALIAVVAVGVARVFLSGPPVATPSATPTVHAAPIKPAAMVRTPEAIATNEDLIRIKGQPPAGCDGWWQFEQRHHPGQSEQRLICNIIRPSAVNRTTTTSGTSVQYVYPQDGSGVLPMLHTYVYATNGVITATQ